MDNSTKKTPDYSTFTVFRRRLPVEAFEALHAEVLRSLREHGLLRGRKLGIDSSVIEAKVSLSGLERRKREERYREYVRGFDADAGVEISDPAAVARFDRSRAGRRTSNREWHHPDDPDARVGRTKSGACDMIYKPEHIFDLESGVVISAEIRHGDEGDTANLADRVAEAAGKVEAIHGEEHDAGNSRVLELAAVRAPEHTVATKSRKALGRARGTHLERGFAHVLECGGLRRTYLRGRENIAKRYRCGIAMARGCVRRATGRKRPFDRSRAGPHDATDSTQLPGRVYLNDIPTLAEKSLWIGRFRIHGRKFCDWVLF